MLSIYFLLILVRKTFIRTFLSQVLSFSLLIYKFTSPSLSYSLFQIRLPYHFLTHAVLLWGRRVDITREVQTAEFKWFSIGVIAAISSILCIKQMVW